jgi:hypothetical protein
MKRVSRIHGVMSMIFLSILFILIGLAMIFARDFMWEFTVVSNQRAGRTSERTELWDTGQIISGAILMLLGAGFICWQVSENSAEAAELANATATAATRLALLEAAFEPYLQAWQQTERQNAYRVSPGDLRIGAGSIYYGRCEGNDFYVYVLRFPGQSDNYAYIPDNEPDDCAPQGLRILSSSPIGEDWYRVTVTGNPESTRAPRPAIPTPEATAE